MHTRYLCPLFCHNIILSIQNTRNTRRRITYNNIEMYEFTDIIRGEIDGPSIRMHEFDLKYWNDSLLTRIEQKSCLKYHMLHAYAFQYVDWLVVKNKNEIDYCFMTENRFFFFFFFLLSTFTFLFILCLFRSFVVEMLDGKTWINLTHRKKLFSSFSRENLSRSPINSIFDVSFLDSFFMLFCCHFSLVCGFRCFFFTIPNVCSSICGCEKFATSNHAVVNSHS